MKTRAPNIINQKIFKEYNAAHAPYIVTIGGLSCSGKTKFFLFSTYFLPLTFFPFHLCFFPFGKVKQKKSKSFTKEKTKMTKGKRVFIFFLIS